MLTREIILLLILIIVIIAMPTIIIISLKKRPIPQLDDMDGRDFEYYCADLLANRGFHDIEVTKGSGDYGVDILAEKEGITFAIQCKHYTSPVGVKAIQEAYAGRDFYDCMVGAVLTNQYFTTPAVEAAKKLKILLWDRGYLEEMLEEVDKDSERV